MTNIDKLCDEIEGIDEDALIDTRNPSDHLCAAADLKALVKEYKELKASNKERLLKGIADMQSGRHPQ